MRILSVSELQAIESAADAAGHSYASMMQRAGAGAARAIQDRLSVADRHVLILVGPGNNGGDGLVVARHLQRAGAIVTAYLTREREARHDPVYRAAVDAGVTIVLAASDEDAATLRQRTSEADVIVDALLGTGATPPLRGTIAAVLKTVQTTLAERSRQPLTPVHYTSRPAPPSPEIVAIDGPSGLDFDTGEVDEMTLRAHLTVTFAMPKWGHVTMPGAARVGDLIVADIGIPESVEISAGPGLTTAAEAAAWLPPRPPDAHKGTFGKAMIVAGSANYTGAAVLASTAAARAGTGLVTLALPTDLHPAVVPAIPEVTYLLLPQALGVVEGHPAAGVVLAHVAAYSTLLIGPGLSNTRESRAFLEALLNPAGGQRNTGFLRGGEREARQAQVLPPLVIDADGLNILAQIPGWPDLLPSDTILTPHPGEMSRLTGTDTAEIQRHRLESAQTWAESWQKIVVLKGAFTVVAAPGREPMLLPFANPGLSSAGTGDVLAGAIVALRAQGVGAFEAAVTGGYLHGLAGEIVTRRLGTAGVLASDVAAALPEAWRRIARFAGRH